MPHDPDKTLEAYGSHVSLRANEGNVSTIEGIDTSRPVRDLRNQISRAIGKTSWNSMRLIYGGDALAECGFFLFA